MKHVSYSLKQLSEKEQVVYIGLGKDFRTFFDKYYAKPLIHNITAVVDNNKESWGNPIYVQGRELTIMSLEQMIKSVKGEYIIMVSSFTYAEEIIESLLRINELSDVEYMSIEDLFYGKSHVDNLSAILETNQGKEPIIPKTIHWCWFGGNPLPEKEQKCVSTWNRFCSDYDVQLWNEDSFDIGSVPYVKEAYEARKYAFVTDYVRLWAIYNYGGIYMDSDVEVVKNLDLFLCENSFSGFEDNLRIPTAVMGSEKGSKYIEELLSYYDGRHFVTKDGYDDQTNVVTITEMTYRKMGFVPDKDFLRAEGLFTMYPREVFCPISCTTGKGEITDNTYAIHRFSGSWNKDC